MTALREPDSLPAPLAGWQRPLAVFAHPDDESFGLGAVLGAFTDAGAHVGALCFTHGEASTLDDGDPRPLRDVRAAELACAAAELGLDDHVLLDHPDGHLADAPVDDLATQVVEVAIRRRADVLVVFDVTGITGHPDHRAATRAALAAAERLDLPVLAWSVPSPVAVVLNVEFGATFTGRSHLEIDVVLATDRVRQRRAIECHRSQSAHNPVLWRRLELSDGTEPLLWLRRPSRPTGEHGRPLPTECDGPAEQTPCEPRSRASRS
jgi:LmbE family N-acetylglucosaminyl deacetylase